MAFLALGINHKTASVAVRERVAFTPEKLVEALREEFPATFKDGQFAAARIRQALAKRGGKIVWEGKE